MTLLIATAVASVIVQQSCSWDHPGRNPFKGDVVASVDHYQDLPKTIRDEIKVKVKAGKPDDYALITNRDISGAFKYVDLRDMHFNSNTVCKTVTRGSWKSSQAEPAPVYCVGTECVIVPNVCSNTSRVTRVKPPAKLTLLPPSTPGDFSSHTYQPLEIPGGSSLELPAPVSETKGPRSLSVLTIAPELPPTNIVATPDVVNGITPPVTSPSFSPINTGLITYPIVGVPVTLVPSTPNPTPVPVPGIGDNPPPVVTPVPEPETYLQLIIGIAAICFVIKSRRS